MRRVIAHRSGGPLAVDRFSRREMLAVGALLLADRAMARPLPAQDISPQLAELERQSGGRLGVAILDCANGRLIGRRLDERFPMCSTFKMMLAAQVLHRAAIGEERLERRVVFTAADLLSYAPVTSQHVGEPGMTIAMLCEAAITMSDNTAANLLLAHSGGPVAFTRFARSIGDPATRLDRIEPALNEARPGDPRDTTTPAAMARSLRMLALGGVLPTDVRALLTGWLIGCRTGAARLRAGLPQGWAVGDKTGTGERGSTNDIAIIWPADRDPVIVAAYMTGATPGADAREAILASVGSLVAGQFEPRGDRANDAAPADRGPLIGGGDGP
jgi:beta-lactamase class A